MFHGNARHRSYYAAMLTRLGLRVILAEYPADGPRDGALGERSRVDDTAQTIALAHRLHAPNLSHQRGVLVAAGAVRRGEYLDISHQTDLPKWSDHAGSGHGPSVRTQTATEPDFAFGSASPTQTPPVTRFTSSPYSFRSMEVITRTEDRSPGF